MIRSTDGATPDSGLTARRANVSPGNPDPHESVTLSGDLAGLQHLTGPTPKPAHPPDLKDHTGAAIAALNIALVGAALVYKALHRRD